MFLFIIQVRSFGWESNQQTRLTQYGFGAMEVLLQITTYYANSPSKPTYRKINVFLLSIVEKVSHWS